MYKKLIYCLIFFLLVTNCTKDTEEPAIATATVSFNPDTLEFGVGVYGEFTADIEYNDSGLTLPDLNITIDPTLPEGIDIDISTGSIKGMSNSTSPFSDYIVKVNGIDADTLSIGVVQALAVAPDSLVYSATRYTFLKGQAIVIPKPTVYPTEADQETEFTVDPILPEGLSITDSGTIEGTISTGEDPYDATNTGIKSYTVKVTNKIDAFITKQIIIEVKPAAPTDLLYTSMGGVTSPSIFNDTIGRALSATPSVRSDASTGSYSVVPEINETFSIRTGLYFNTNTGIFSSTNVLDTLFPGERQYVVTYTNASGSVSDTVNFEFWPIKPGNISYDDIVFVLGERTNKGVYIPSVMPSNASHLTYQLLNLTGGEFDIVSVSSGLEFDPVTGSIFGVPAVLEGEFETTIQMFAINKSGSSDTVSFLIQTIDVVAMISSIDYNTPSGGYELFLGSPSVVPSPTVDPSQAKPTIRYELDDNNPFALPAGLTFNTTTGAVEGIPEVYNPDTVEYGVKAFNINTPNGVDATFRIRVLAPSIEDIRYDLSEYIFNLHQSGDSISSPEILTSAADNDVVYRIDPELPSGLSLDITTGIVRGTPVALTGTPTNLVPVTHTVSATNLQNTRTTIISIAVRPDAPDSVRYLNAEQSISKGQAIDILPPSIFPSDGAIGITFSSVVLPPGLQLDPSTGRISGTIPPDAILNQRTEIQITATNITGKVNTTIVFLGTDVAPESLVYQDTIYTIYQLEPLNVPRPTVGPEGVTGLSFAIYQVFDTLQGVTRDDDFNSEFFLNENLYENPTIDSSGTIIPAIIPEGIVFDRTFGQFSGTPLTSTNSIVSIVVSVLNGTSRTSTANLPTDTFKFRVLPARITGFNYDSIPSVVSVDGFFNSKLPTLAPPQASGIVYSIDTNSSKPLPIGFTFDTSTGVILGNSSEELNVVYTITASNVSGFLTANVTLNIRTLPADSIEYNASLANIAIGRLVNINPPTIFPSEGVSNLKFSSSPALPSGMILDSNTGGITGLVSISAPLDSQSYIISAVNTANQPATYTLTFEVKPVRISEFSYSGVSSISSETQSLKYTLVDGQAFSTPFPVGVNLSHAAEFSIITGAILPNGLSIDPSSGKIAGIIATSAYDDTVTVLVENVVSSQLIEIAFEVIESSALPLEFNYTVTQRNTGNLIDWLPSFQNAPLLGGLTYELLPGNSLPEGMELYLNTGVISGIPVKSFDGTVFVIAKTQDVNPLSDTATVNILIEAVKPDSIVYELGNTYNVIELDTLVIQAPTIASIPGAISVENVFDISPIVTGISINDSTGSITIDENYNPVSATMEYTVTAMNDSGSAMRSISITQVPISIVGVKLSAGSNSTLIGLREVRILNVSSSTEGDYSNAFSIDGDITASNAIDGSDLSTFTSAFGGMLTFDVSSVAISSVASIDFSIFGVVSMVFPFSFEFVYNNGKSYTAIVTDESLTLSPGFFPTDKKVTVTLTYDNSNKSLSVDAINLTDEVLMQ